jgi:RNA polymerase sigma-70 factor (ECF subfamily)
MTSEGIDEIDVITNIRLGKTDQYEFIIRQYQNEIVKLVSTLMLSPEENATITQHIFLKSFENLHLFNLDSSFDNWIKKIAVNEVLTYIKEAKDIPFHLLHYFSELEQHLTFEDFFESYNEKLKEIESFTNQQPQIIKKVLQLRYQKNYPVSKIAELMDKKPSNIEKILYLSRKHLSESLYQEEVTIS